MAMDFLGRQESLQEDFRHLCERLGVNSCLPHLNVYWSAAMSRSGTLLVAYAPSGQACLST
jgi:hypothetical protein